MSVHSKPSAVRKNPRERSRVMSTRMPRDVARRKMSTKAFLKSRDQRKRVEMRFAHLKTHHRFERLRLRGLSGARDEFHLAAIEQNPKTLALPHRLLPRPPVAETAWQVAAAERLACARTPATCRRPAVRAAVPAPSCRRRLTRMANLVSPPIRTPAARCRCLRP